MNISLRSKQAGRFAGQTCLVLAFTTVSWMLAGCDAQPATPTAGDEAATSAVEQSHTIRLTNYNFDRKVLDSAQPVLVDFWAGWCTPCREMAPTIEELADDFEGRAVVGKVDVDAHPEIAKRFQIDGIPVVLFFHNGQLVDRLEGGSSKTELARRLTMLLESPSVSDLQSHVE